MSWIILLALVIVASFASCSKERKVEEITVSGDMQVHGMKTDWKFTLPQGNPAEGRKLFVETECYKCHEVKGETFPAVGRGEKGIGPELSQMAGMHPPEFFAESIINPNAVIDPDATKLAYVGEDGKSKMPDYDSVLTVKQVADLAAYLSSLRKGESKGH